MTKKQYLDLNPHARILLGPGPGMAAPRVVRAMATPPVGHLDPDLLKIYTEEQELLRYVFQTQNEWTFALSGTGTSGATLRVYFDQYQRDPSLHGVTTQKALAPLMEAAEQLASVRATTGRDAPDVIT